MNNISFFRYGWFSHADPGSGSVRSQAPLSSTNEHNSDIHIVNEQIVNTTPKSSPPTNQESENLLDIHEGWLSDTRVTTLTPSSTMANETIGGTSTGPNSKMARSCNHASELILNCKESATGTVQEENRVKYLSI